MANTLTKNYSTLILKKILPGFMADQVLTQAVDTQLLDGEINQDTGSTVQFKRPQQFSAITTADGDLSSSTPSNLVSATATGTVDNMITVWVKWTQVERAIQLNQLDQLLAPMKDTMVSKLETTLASKMLLAASAKLGATGTAIDAWADVAQVGSYFKDLGVNNGYMAAIDPWSAQNLASLQTGLSGPDAMIKSAWDMAQINRDFAGVKAFTTNTLETYTTGTGSASASVKVKTAPTVTYAALKDTYQITISLKGFGAGETVPAGTQVEIEGLYLLNQQTKQRLIKNNVAINWVGTVQTLATADGAGDASVTLSGAPIYDATNPQYNTVHKAIAINDDVIVHGTASTTYKPSLAFTKGFYGLGFVKLDKLEGWDSTIVDYKGVSMRATRSSDPTTGVSSLRLDVLPAFCCFNPMLGGHLFGN